MSLRLDNISYTYSAGLPSAVQAVRAVDFMVSPGELVLLLGATGSGKSTLMRLLAGLLPFQEGSGSVDDRSLDLAAARGRIGLIFQDAESQLFADTLTEDVAFGPRNLGMESAEARRAAGEALDAVGLAHGVFGERSPFSLSGGEARRAAIAGVLAMSPRYLLADEPTAGLDAPGRRAVRHLLSRARERAGVVVVSHAAEEFLADADRVVMLSEGAVVWSGSAADAASPDAFAAAGLRVPDVLDVQQRAAACGIAVSAYAFDPATAARGLAAALEGRGRS